MCKLKQQTRQNMTRKHEELLRAAIALQVAILEDVDEDFDHDKALMWIEKAIRQINTCFVELKKQK